MLKTADDQTFYNETKEGLVLVDFYATWCGPCKMLAPVLEELAVEQADISIVKVDIDESAVTAGEYGIMSVPSLLLLKDGEKIAQTAGYQPKDLLAQWIAEYK